jgi:hypothetical protein
MSVSRPATSTMGEEGGKKRTHQRAQVEKSMSVNTHNPRLWRRYKYAERYKNTSTR